MVPGKVGQGDRACRLCGVRSQPGVGACQLRIIDRLDRSGIQRSEVAFGSQCAGVQPDRIDDRGGSIGNDQRLVDGGKHFCIDRAVGSKRGVDGSSEGGHAGADRRDLLAHAHFQPGVAEAAVGIQRLGGSCSCIARIALGGNQSVQQVAAACCKLRAVGVCSGQLVSCQGGGDRLARGGIDRGQQVARGAQLAAGCGIQGTYPGQIALLCQLLRRVGAV